jgi:hypothetical protein
MKTLSDVEDAGEIRSRLLALTAHDRPQWGVMNVTQMVCHLREPYLFALSPEPGRHVKLAVPPKVAKYLALGPLARWPKNLPTLEEFRIGGASMATKGFVEDHASLLEAFDRFCAAPSLTKDHPFFTKMEHGDWMLWGYRHADHHLRQFGR